MNNPFAHSPQSVVDATAQRFPDVLASDPSLQQGQHQAYSQPPLPQSQYQQQQQQQQPYLQQQYTGFQPQQQQLHPQQTGYPHPYALAPQQTGFGGGASPYGASPSYGQPSPAPQMSYQTADLDPYAALGALPHQQQSTSGSSSSAGQPAQGAFLEIPQTQSHPRQYVQENKQGLMAWDEYAWKQLLNRLDALREAWEHRQAGLKAAANQGADPFSVEQLQRQASEYIDSIHAAKMQLNEVKSGWRHSTDAASKARVREALNAGLSSLPDYPPPVSPEQLGGAFYRQASESYRKQSILSQFNAPSQPQYGAQQPQPTGYGIQPQPTGYGGGLQPQQTGYGMGMQQTGYGGMGGMGMQPQPTGYVQPQQTGYYGGGAGGMGGGYGSQQYFG
ncbi:hypothetical protein JCM1841_001986 [Sporobolomyces salmonicolor]